MSAPLLQALVFRLSTSLKLFSPLFLQLSERLCARVAPAAIGVHFFPLPVYSVADFFTSRPPFLLRIRSPGQRLVEPVHSGGLVLLQAKRFALSAYRVEVHRILRPQIPICESELG